MQRWERIAKRVDQETSPVYRITKSEIAQRLKISRPALDRRLKGRVGWKYDELETLAELFNVTVNELIAEENSDSHTPVPADP